MKSEKIEMMLFQVLFLTVAGIIISRVIGLNSLSSLLFTLTFPETVLIWLYSVRKGLTKQDWMVLGTAALALVCVVIDALRCGGTLSFSYLRKYIMFVMTLLYFQSCYKTTVGKQMFLFLERIVDALTVFLVVMILLFWKRMHMINDIVTIYATFNFSNPNMVGLYLICMYMLKFCSLLLPGSRRDKIIRGVLTAALALLILDTKSRNGLMVIMLFTAVGLLVMFRDQIKKKLGLRIPLRISHRPAVCLASFPALFSVLYMALISADWVQVVFGFLSREGKKIDSRVKTWSPGMEAIWEYPLFGSYYTISEGTGASQMHNTHVDIAASYGVPVLILVCVLLTCYIFQDGKTHTSKYSLLYMAGFCCALLMGTFEAAVFSGGMGIYVFAGMFLLLTNPKTLKKQKQETL